ncbi:UNKNOWN [Stylonychia lemnae]|uniref:Uncharacterized protein n=1 Tax=Stylonychia lemnae TaxID=5949 RepID=A0A077ZZF7_STYLE|nr:UNKNOWN [Stylonychia lemnae]|eukprot:CDW74613.1 UNKNOWN [Stylonychia lemnae]
MSQKIECHSPGQNSHEDISLPQGFLDDQILSPSFYMPENEELKYGTHNNIRRTLFYSIFRNVKYVEFKRLKSEDDYFELKTPVEPWDEGLYDRFMEKFITKEKQRGKLIAVQKWVVNRNDEGEGLYRVKIYQMDDDEFRDKIYPQSYKDMLRYYWFNRKHFRIL